VVSSRRGRVKLGIVAPSELRIERDELRHRVQRENPRPAECPN
jgi:sRNA-binding carbon storage regulator CsrA